MIGDSRDKLKRVFSAKGPADADVGLYITVGARFAPGPVAKRKEALRRALLADSVAELAFSKSASGFPTAAAFAGSGVTFAVTRSMSRTGRGSRAGTIRMRCLGDRMGTVQGGFFVATRAAGMTAARDTRLPVLRIGVSVCRV